jgi:hypothetical protein
MCENLCHSELKGQAMEKGKSYKVVQIWPGRFVCKQVTVCPGHIWTTLYYNMTHFFRCVENYVFGLNEIFLYSGIINIYWTLGNASLHLQSLTNHGVVFSVCVASFNTKISTFSRNYLLCYLWFCPPKEWQSCSWTGPWGSWRLRLQNF